VEVTKIRGPEVVTSDRGGTTNITTKSGKILKRRYFMNTPQRIAGATSAIRMKRNPDSTKYRPTPPCPSPSQPTIPPEFDSSAAKNANFGSHTA
jgi:hypothetical protein